MYLIMEDLNFNPANLFVIFFLFIGASILIFLLLRELFCWYWKINKRILLAERQNLLLEKILLQLKETSPNANDSLSIEKVIETNLTNDIIKNSDVYESLINKEKEEVDKFLKHGLRPGEKIVINKKSREIDRFSEKKWKELCDKFDDVNWQIIFFRN